MKYDIRQLTLAADTLLKTTTEPLHRKILNNYRRHAMLEVSGRYEEIFAPDMTVEEPFYRVHTPEGQVVARVHAHTGDLAPRLGICVGDRSRACLH